MINAIGKVIKGVCSLLSPPLLLAVGVVIARKVLASNPQVSTKETAGSSVHYPNNKQAAEHQAKDSATAGKSAQQCCSGDGIASAEESRISALQNDPCITEDNALLLPQFNTSASPSNSGEPLTDEVCAGNSNGGEVDQDVHFPFDSLQYNDCKVFSPSNTHATNDDLLPRDSRKCSPDEMDLHANKERSEPEESDSAAHVQCESPLPEDSKEVSPDIKTSSAENKGTGAECSACPQPAPNTPDDTLCVDLPETSSCLLFTGASNVYRCDETVKSHLLYGPPLLVSKQEHIVGCSSSPCRSNLS